MAEQPLATLIHISDLHFGPTLENSERHFHRVFAGTIAQGMYPHDYAIARALALSIRALIENRVAHGVPVVVVHTGDLTRMGKPNLRCLAEVTHLCFPKLTTA